MIGIPHTGNGRPRRRVLFVESYPHVMAGQQKTMLSLLEQVPRDRLEPLLAVPSDGPFLDAVSELDVPSVVLPYPALLGTYGGAVYRYRGWRRAMFGWQAVRYGWQIRRRLRELRVSGIFANDMRGLLTVGPAARSLGIPVMIWDKLDQPHGWLDLMEFPLANVTAMISEAVKRKFPDWQLRRYRRQLHTIPNGTDVATFDAAQPIRDELGLGKDDIAIGLVGTVTHRKGQDRLLAIVPELVSRVPGAVVLLVGEASGSAEDDQYRRDLPNRDHPRVRFLGQRQDMPAIMQSLDMLVTPSRHEGLGRVNTEAMACRKPVVGARAGGIPEVVQDHETGFIVEGNDAPGLLQAVVTLCRDPALRAAMGQAGRRRVERLYDRRVQIDKVLALLERLVRGKGKRWARQSAGLPTSL